MRTVWLRGKWVPYVLGGGVLQTRLWIPGLTTCGRGLGWGFRAGLLQGGGPTPRLVPYTYWLHTGHAVQQQPGDL